MGTRYQQCAEADCPNEAETPDGLCRDCKRTKPRKPRPKP